MTLRGFLLCLLSTAFAVGAQAQVTTPGQCAPLDGQEGQGDLPNRLAGAVGVQEKLAARVPTDLTFVNERGQQVSFGSLVNGERPTVVAFVYHTCPMLCSLVMDGLADAVASADGVELGPDYQVLAVSVDPSDTPARADSVKARYARLNDLGDLDAFHVWTLAEGHEDDVKTLADAVGFEYAFDVRTGEYAHNAALILLSPEGKVTRYLYGIDHQPFDFRLAVVESGEGTVGSSLDKFLITCFEYNEEAQSYSLAILNWTKLGGLLLLLTFGGMLVWFWRRESGKTPDSWQDTHPSPVA